MQKVAKFTEMVRPHRGSGPTQSIRSSSSSVIGELRGRIDGLTESGYLYYRLTTAKPLDLIRVWICHLALNLVRPIQLAPNYVTA